MLIAKNIKEATFLERLNRFLGIVNMNDEKFECFIPNPGRMKELLIKGRNIWLKKVKTGNRKTEYDLIAVEHEGKVISIDSRVSNKLVHHLL